jgi:hypothetical protein
MTDRKTSYPVDFAPNENNRQNAARWGLDLAYQLEAFSDYHQSRGSRFIKWNLALNTWLRLAHEKQSKFGRRTEVRDFAAELRLKQEADFREKMRVRDGKFAN